VTLPINTDPNLFYTYIDVQGYRYYAGETFNITLDRLQIFQLDVKNGFDLSGLYSLYLLVVVHSGGGTEWW